MKQRVITAIVLVVLFLPCVIVSGIPFKILMAFIGVMATYELYSRFIILFKRITCF